MRYLKRIFEYKDDQLENLKNSCFDFFSEMVDDDYCEVYLDVDNSISITLYIESFKGKHFIDLDKFYENEKSYSKLIDDFYLSYKRLMDHYDNQIGSKISILDDEIILVITLDKGKKGDYYIIHNKTATIDFDRLKEILNLPKYTKIYFSRYGSDLYSLKISFPISKTEEFKNTQSDLIDRFSLLKIDDSFLIDELSYKKDGKYHIYCSDVDNAIEFGLNRKFTYDW